MRGIDALIKIIKEQYSPDMFGLKINHQLCNKNGDNTCGNCMFKKECWNYALSQFYTFE